jgi:hypothetical protein
MTSKRSILEKAVAGSGDYAADIRALVREGKGARKGIQYASGTE